MLDHLKQLARLAARYTEQLISEEHPLLSGTLPGGYRIQIVYPPAVDWAVPRSNLHSPGAECRNRVDSRRGDVAAQRIDFFRTAVAQRKNILISGGTSSGETTFLNACLKEIPSHERIITIEDAREVHPPHPNRLHLLASRGDQGRAKVTTQQLLEASLRLRPDRIILGEIRGTECVTYWSAINSGHPGSLTSIHADTLQLAFEKLVMLGMQAGLGFTRDHIVDYLRHTVDVVVQLRRDAEGRRYISDVWDVVAPSH